MKHDALKTFSALKASLEQERAQLQARLNNIQAALGGAVIPTPTVKQELVWEIEPKPKRGPGRPKGTKGGMSAAGRAAIVAAQKARWAKKNEQEGFTAPQLTVVAKPVVEPSKPAKKRRISAAGRAALIAGAKARWAKYNAAKGLTTPEASKPGPAKPEIKKPLATTPTTKFVQESKPAKRRKVSAAGRANIAAAAKARWAKRKAK